MRGLESGGCNPCDRFNRVDGNFRRLVRCRSFSRHRFALPWGASQTMQLDAQEPRYRQHRADRHGCNH
ncbi:hypothetical protein, partial [Streptomyces fuscichromogenes]|uniref:hypothetical protein n=1 Tax=Streptomyces fuscichromogenes TaxID=1324013 RepID=UPI001E5DA466